MLGAPSVGGETPSKRVRQFVENEEAALEADDLDHAVELNLRLWVDGPQREAHEVNQSVRQLVGTMQRDAFLVDEPDGVTLKPEPPAALERLHELQAPALVIRGALDLPEKNDLAQHLAHRLPDARLVTLPAAHMMSLEEPMRFNEEVLDFLRQVDFR